MRLPSCLTVVLSVLCFLATSLSPCALADEETGAPTLLLEDTAEDETDGEAAPFPSRVRRRLDRQFPKKSHVPVLDFYEQNGPGFLFELDNRCQQSPESGADYFEELRARLKRIHEARQVHKSAEQHLLKIVHRQNECLERARRVRHLHRSLNLKESSRNDLKNRILSEEKQLLQALGELFISVQQHQLIEIQRLEAELTELRRLIQQRDANRESIIQAQFDELVGDPK